MSYVIAVFGSRNDTLKFYNRLKQNGVKASVIATPKIPSVRCGVCVKIKWEDYEKVKKIMLGKIETNFLGFYEIKIENNKLVTKKL